MSDQERNVPVSESAPDTASGGPSEEQSTPSTTDDDSSDDAEWALNTDWTTDDDGTPVENPSGG